MKAASTAFQEIRKRLHIAPDSSGANKVKTKVELTEVQVDNTIELVEGDLLISVGEIRDRLEGTKLNSFAPSEVVVTLHDPQDYPVFYKADGSGLFDDLGKKYQAKVYKGMEIGGSMEWWEMFDGEVKNNTIERKGHHRIELTVIGWLKEAERYNAEEVADPNNFPFKNIKGISFVGLSGEHPITGAKTLSFSIEDEKNYLQYEGGIKKEISADGNFNCFSATREEYITLACDISEMPTESKTDNFPIINYGGTFHACYWYENIPLETIVNYLIDKLEEGTPGAITRDIDVREIESELEKNFVYLGPKLFMPNNNLAISAFITAVKLIDYNAGTNVITFLIGVRSRVDGNVFNDKNYCYKIVIDVNNDTYTATRITVEINTEYQLSRFLHFANRWWVVLGYPTECDLTPNDPYRYWAYKIYRFNVALTTTDYVLNFGSNPPSNNYSGDDDWYIYLVHTAEVLEGTSNDMYIILQDRSSGVYRVLLRKFNWNGSILVESVVDTLGFYDSGEILSGLISDDYATIFKLDNTNKNYVYGIRHITYAPGGYDINDLQIRRYDIDVVTFTTIKEHNSVYGGVVNMSRNLHIPNNHWRAFYYYQSSAIPYYRGYWIDKNGIAWVPVTGNNKTNYIFSSLFTRYDMWWMHNPGTNSWRIGRKDVESDYQDYIEAKYLFSDYEGSQVAPMVYKENDVTDCEYCGVVLDKNDRGIVPFLYRANALSTVHLADFTDMSVRRALTELGIFALDIVSRPGLLKVIFRYRESFRDTDTLDSNDCDAYPVVKIWKHYYDGVIIENSKYNLRTRRGETGFNAKVLRIDSRFVSEGTIEAVADFYYNFYNKIKKYIFTQRDMYVEPETMDKIVKTIRQPDGSVMWNLNTIVMASSFVSSPKGKDFYRMKLELLEIEGATYHEHILEEVPGGELVE